MSELLSWIKEGEGLHQDFKFRIDDQSKIARTLVAFGNSSGGRLLVGVKDNGKIVGCDPQEEFFMIDGAAELFCQPKIDFKTAVIKEGHHIVLEVRVEPSPIRHKAKDEDGKWTYYYRYSDFTLKGNAVLNEIWRLQKQDIRRPEKFSEVEIGVIKMIRDKGPISLSQINKYSKIGFKELSLLLGSLVYWNVIDLELSQKEMRYCLSND